jgi:hypothetical protein
VPTFGITLGVKAGNYHHLLADEAIQQTVRKSLKEGPSRVSTNDRIHPGVLKYRTKRVLNREKKLPS